MHIATHALMGWCLAESFPSLTRREKGWVTLAAVLPDVDGLGIVVELATRDGANPRYWYSDYHHVLGHNLLFATLLAIAATFFTRATTGMLVFLAVHLHILGDLAGSRGPDGYQWPIPYLSPFARTELAWPGQWQLDAWPNFAVTIGLMTLTIAWAHRRGYSIVGLLSPRADRAFVEVLRRRIRTS